MSKKIKALLAVVLCAAMLIAAASPAFAAVDNNDVLRFNKDGKFKIMQISDTQDIDIPREAMIMFMEKALDAEKPDLVVFTGDQLAGGKIKTAEGVYAGIKAILQPVVDRGIPFTFVFGNHDNDDGCPVAATSSSHIIRLSRAASHMTQCPRCTAPARTTCLSMPPRAARRSSTSG